MSWFPFRSLEKAILAPSGDHAGSVSIAGLFVRRSSPLPSAFITYTSELPSRTLTNAIRVPSGDQAAWKLSHVSGVSRFTSEASSFTT